MPHSVPALLRPAHPPPLSGLSAKPPGGFAFCPHRLDGGDGTEKSELGNLAGRQQAGEKCGLAPFDPNALEPMGLCVRAEKWRMPVELRLLLYDRKTYGRESIQKGRTPAIARSTSVRPRISGERRTSLVL